jgi:hypothetical protein
MLRFSCYALYLLVCCVVLFQVPATLQAQSATAGHESQRMSSWRNKGFRRSLDGTKAELYHSGTLVEAWYTQPLDHFQFGKNDKNNVFKQRFAAFYEPLMIFHIFMLKQSFQNMS